MLTVISKLIIINNQSECAKEQLEPNHESKFTSSNAFLVKLTKTRASFVSSDSAPLYCSQFVAIKTMSAINSVRE